jgi:hypothetical protein
LKERRNSKDSTTGSLSKKGNTGKGFESMKLLSLLFLAYCSSSTGEAARPRRFSEECKTPEPENFEGLWVLELIGRPGLAAEQDVVDLEEAIQSVYGCNKQGEYYDLVNVTVRLDLMDDHIEGSAEETGYFSWPVSIKGMTNLKDINLEDRLFDYPTFEPLYGDRREVLDNHDEFWRRNVQECACILPSREDFVSALSAFILPMAYIDEV